MKGNKTHYRLLWIFGLLAILMPQGSPAEPLDRWQWRNPFLRGNSLRISYGNGIFVAVGEGGAISTSTDGSTWTLRNSGTKDPLLDVAYGSGTFVAVGSNGTILTSPDGIRWRSRDPGTTANLNGVAFGLDHFVAVGDDGVIRVSADGAAWKTGDSGTQQVLQKVAYGNRTFVAVGLHGIILTSPSGAVWRMEAAGTAGHLEDITYGRETFVAVGETILTSPDGITWRENGPQTNHHFLGVAYGSGTFVAVADNGVIYTSPDGSVWMPRDSGTHLSLWAIAYGKESFVIATENGTFLQSALLPSPRISVSPPSLDFGSVNVGSSSPQTLTIMNSGSADLTIQRLVIGGTHVIDFITQNDQCTGTALPPSDHCTLQIVFSPHDLGSKSATLSISSNDPTTPTEVVSLSGSSNSGFSSGSEGAFCFISSLVDGSGLEKYLDIFRKFRDFFLLENKMGKTLVGIYYRESPSLARWFTRHDSLRNVTRWALVPLAALAYCALQIPGGAKAFLLALMIGVMTAGLIIPCFRHRIRKTQERVRNFLATEATESTES